MTLLRACRTAPYIAVRSHALSQQPGLLRVADAVIKSLLSTFCPSKAPKGTRRCHTLVRGHVVTGQDPTILE